MNGRLDTIFAARASTVPSGISVNCSRLGRRGGWGDMVLLLIAFGLALLTSAMCILAVLMHWILSGTPAKTCAMLLIPVAIAGFPLLFPRGGKARIGTAYAAALLLFVWAAITGFSVGMFYLPATVVMGVAAVRMAAKTPLAKRGEGDRPS